MISRHFIMISRHIFVMISKHTAWLEDSGVSLKTSMKEAFSKISENLHENICETSSDRDSGIGVFLWDLSSS